MPARPAPPPAAAPAAGRAAALHRALFVLLWSSGVVGGAVGVRHMAPLSLTAARFAISAAAASAIALALRAPWPRERRALRDLAISGLLLQALQFGGFYLAFAHDVPAAVLALVLGLNPVATSLLAGPLLGERTSARQWAGLALGVAGVATAVAGGLAVDGPMLGGLGFAALGLLGLALGTVQSRRAATGAHPLSGLAVQLAVATLPLTALALVAEDASLTSLHPDAAILATLAWLALVNSLGATSLLFALVRRDGAARTSALFLVMPPVTALLGWAALGQPLTGATIAGLALSALGLRLGLGRPPASASAAAEAAAVGPAEVPSRRAGGRLATRRVG